MVSKRHSSILVAVLLLAGLIGASGNAAAVTTPEEYDIDLTAHPAPTIALDGEADVTASLIETAPGLPPAPAAGIHCRYGIRIHFSGVRNLQTGIVSGNWGHNSSIKCNAPMEYLYTQADLLYQGSVYSAAPADDCDAVFDRNCQIVASNGAAGCGFCNGSWRGRGDYTIEFPAAFLVTDYDRQRCSTPTPNTVICTLRTGRIHL